MTFAVSVHHGSYLLAVASGEIQISDALGAIDMLSKVCIMHNYRRVLIDTLSAAAPLNEDEHRALGIHTAEMLSSLDRVAVVVNSESRVGTGEAAAKQKGLRIRTFTDIVEASEWIAAPETEQERIDADKP